MSTTATSRSLQRAWLLLTPLLMATPLHSIRPKQYPRGDCRDGRNAANPRCRKPRSLFRRLPTDDLRRAGIETSQQLADFTPGLVIQRDVISKVVIRGIGTENFTIAGDPGVAINFDEVYIARSSAAIFDLYDMQRVEVLSADLKAPCMAGTLLVGQSILSPINPPRHSKRRSLRMLATTTRPASKGRSAVRWSTTNYSVVCPAWCISGDGYTDNVFPNVGRGSG